MGQCAIPSWINRHSYHSAEQTVKIKKLDHRVYSYELGNAPSAGRAIGHGVMDVLTLGLWEVVGTPIEAFQGETRRLSVTYGADDRVLTMSASAPTPL
jgi:hypothetical protein